MRPRFDASIEAQLAHLDLRGVLKRENVDIFFGESERVFATFLAKEPELATEILRGIFGNPLIGSLQSWKQAVNRQTLGDLAHQAQLIAVGFEFEKVIDLPLAVALQSQFSGGAKLGEFSRQCSENATDIVNKVGKAFREVVPNPERWRRIRNATSHNKVNIDIGKGLVSLGKDGSAPSISMTLGDLHDFAVRVAVYQGLAAKAMIAYFAGDSSLQQRVMREMEGQEVDFVRRLGESLITPTDFGVPWEGTPPDVWEPELADAIERKFRQPADRSAPKATVITKAVARNVTRFQDGGKAQAEALEQLLHNPQALAAAPGNKAALEAMKNWYNGTVPLPTDKTCPKCGGPVVSQVRPETLDATPEGETPKRSLVCRQESCRHIEDEAIAGSYK